MQLFRTASAGTLESSDCIVTIAPSDKYNLDYRGANKVLFEERTDSLVKRILQKNSVLCADVLIQDQGALAVTIKACLEAALFRAAVEL